MAGKRDYKVKGTKDFLVLAGIFFFLCIWAIKDAWYPSPGVLEKHPLQVNASFLIDGSVGRILVAEGDTVAEEQVLAEIRSTSIQKAFETAKTLYSAEKKVFSELDASIRAANEKGVSEAEVAVLRERLAESSAKLDEFLNQVTVERDRLDMTDLKSPVKGVVEKIVTESHTKVAAGETVLTIHPDDHFYLFNKSLAIFSFIAFWVFLGIHVLAR